MQRIGSFRVDLHYIVMHSLRLAFYWLASCHAILYYILLLCFPCTAWSCAKLLKSVQRLRLTLSSNCACHLRLVCVNLVMLILPRKKIRNNSSDQKKKKKKKPNKKNPTTTTKSVVGSNDNFYSRNPPSPSLKPPLFPPPPQQQTTEKLHVNMT